MKVRSTHDLGIMSKPPTNDPANALRSAADAGRDASHEPRRGLLLVDHGTRNPEANARLAELGDAIALARPDWLVAYAHMELAMPDVPMAVSALASAGATRILVHLHFLVAGFHVRESIPELLAAARAEHPEIEFKLGTPIGEDPRLKDIVLERMDD